MHYFKVACEDSAPTGSTEYGKNEKHTVQFLLYIVISNLCIRHKDLFMFLDAALSSTPSMETLFPSNLRVALLQTMYKALSIFELQGPSIFPAMEITPPNMKIMKSLLCSSPSSLNRWTSHPSSLGIWIDLWFPHAPNSWPIVLGDSSVLQNPVKTPSHLQSQWIYEDVSSFFQPPTTWVPLHPCKCPSLQRCRHTQCDSALVLKSMADVLA